MPISGALRQSSLPALTRRNWAWEFLRRNPDYRQQWQLLQSLGEPVAEAHSGDFDRWGLLFRRRSD